MAALKLARPGLRAERAAQTRQRILESARKLFATRGYGATSLTAIAADAGVAVQTVYAVFGSKAGILRALGQAVLKHAEAGRLYEAALKDPSPARKLELFSASIRQRWEYGHDVVAIHAEAGRTDATIRHEVDEVLSTRRSGIERLAASLQPRLPARTRRMAFPILDALTLPEIYAELVGIVSWSPDEYEDWLFETLKQQLLGE